MTSKAAISGSHVIPAPAKCAWISFLALSAFVTPLLFIVPLPEKVPVAWFWPGMYLYCGLLSVLVAGLMQINFRVGLGLGIFSLIFMSISAVGVRLCVHSNGNADAMARGQFLLKIAVDLGYFLFAAAVILSARGWIVGSRRNASHKKCNPIDG